MGISALDAMLKLDHPRKVEATVWADQHLPGSDEMRDRLVDRDVWKTAAGAGLLGIFIPEAFGGSPVSSVEAALIYEGLGASSADNGVVFAVASQAFAANKAVALSATDAQAKRWLPGLADGSLFASFAMSEPGAGSDAASIATTATRCDDGWRLEGEKIWATLAPIGDVAVVFASTDPARGQWGLSAFLVDLSLPGITASAPIKKMGLRSSPFGRLTFSECVIPEDALLGRPGSGAAIFRSVVEAERAFLYAAQIGAMERVINQSIEHGRSRHQNGVHIGSHQAVSHRIVDMKLRHEAARLLLYKAAAIADSEGSLTLAAALTKLWTADASISTTIDGMRTFGASGYTDDIGIEGHVRDSLAGLSYSGTTDVARNVVASLLGLNLPES